MLFPNYVCVVVVSLIANAIKGQQAPTPFPTPETFFPTAKTDNAWAGDCDNYRWVKIVVEFLYPPQEQPHHFLLYQTEQDATSTTEVNDDDLLIELPGDNGSPIVENTKYFIDFKSCYRRYCYKGYSSSAIVSGVSQYGYGNVYVDGVFVTGHPFGIGQSTIMCFSVVNEPSTSPSDVPSNTPTDAPTASPTESPTEYPTASPTESPTDAPTASPTANPTPGKAGKKKKGKKNVFGKWIKKNPKQKKSDRRE